MTRLFQCTFSLVLAIALSTTALRAQPTEDPAPATTPPPAGGPSSPEPAAPSPPELDAPTTRPAPGAPPAEPAPTAPAPGSGDPPPAPAPSEPATSDAAPSPPPAAPEPAPEATPTEPPLPDQEQIYEPPLPTPYVDQEPVLPPEPRRIAPNSSLWLGARTGWFFPMGSLWQDGEPIGGVCCAYFNRGWDDFASSGPMIELNLGARLGHAYNLFGIWEYAFLGDGDELDDEFGGQASARSNFLGVGLRFSTNPDAIGLMVEMALGWRRFTATWDNGTEFSATDDFFNTRIAFGADIRLNESLAISPMLALGGGVFGEAEWKFSDGSREGAFSTFGEFLVDEPGQHVPVSLQVGIHYDAFASR